MTVVALQTITPVQVLAANSKSFDLASRVLRPDDRENVAVLYAWCRRVDDEIDLSPRPEQEGRLSRLRWDLDAVYAGHPQTDPLLVALQRVVVERALPSEYPHALLDGMAMDVRGERYASLEDLYRYCWRVAGVVGVMLCHLFHVKNAEARRPAAQLGVAMQLTNVCRDVLEDWDRGRLYLPEQLLCGVGLANLSARLGAPLPLAFREPLARAVEALLTTADGFYARADTGMASLPPRAGFAVRVARRLYSDIGTTLRARGCDVFAGRAVVPPRRKLRLVFRAFGDWLVDLHQGIQFQPAPLDGVIEFPRDVLG